MPQCLPSNYELEKLINYDIESMLARIQLHLMSTKDVEGFFKVFDMVSLFALNEYVINIDLNIMTDMVFEDLID